jgi:hypothetical protein
MVWPPLVVPTGASCSRARCTASVTAAIPAHGDRRGSAVDHGVPDRPGPVELYTPWCEELTAEPFSGADTALADGLACVATISSTRCEYV